ncbi:MAG: 30S ribosomal protein S6 [Parcubacteria group bacterium]|nr:30S ribosomal protein S6 [Parcubacteria group bacterium]
MQPYELCALFAGSNGPDQIQERKKQVDGLLVEIKAEVKHTHAMGRKKLAYAIAGEAHGEYAVWLFEAEPQAVQTLSGKLRLAGFVLRSVVTKLENVSIEERIKNLQDAKAGKSIAREETEDVREERHPRPTAAPRAAISGSEYKSEHKKEEKKVSLEELDEKLDEILDSDKL